LYIRKVNAGFVCFSLAQHQIFHFNFVVERGWRARLGETTEADEFVCLLVYLFRWGLAM
jgi:hypothetical protein